MASQNGTRIRSGFLAPNLRSNVRRNSSFVIPARASSAEVWSSRMARWSASAGSAPASSSRNIISQLRPTEGRAVGVRLDVGPRVEENLDAFQVVLFDGLDRAVVPEIRLIGERSLPPGATNEPYRGGDPGSRRTAADTRSAHLWPGPRPVHAAILPCRCLRSATRSARRFAPTDRDPQGPRLSKCGPNVSERTEGDGFHERRPLDLAVVRPSVQEQPYSVESTETSDSTRSPDSPDELTPEKVDDAVCRKQRQQFKQPGIAGNVATMNRVNQGVVPLIPFVVNVRTGHDQRVRLFRGHLRQAPREGRRRWVDRERSRSASLSLAMQLILYLLTKHSLGIVSLDAKADLRRFFTCMNGRMVRIMKAGRHPGPQERQFLTKCCKETKTMSTLTDPSSYRYQPPPAPDPSLLAAPAEQTPPSLRVAPRRTIARQRQELPAQR